jgi:hypothetical protein
VSQVAAHSGCLPASNVADRAAQERAARQHHRRAPPGNLSARSIQFGTAVAPSLPQRLQRMRGPKDGTVASSADRTLVATVLACHEQATERSIPNGGSNFDYLGCRLDHRRLCGDAAFIHHQLDRALVLVGWLANQTAQSRIQMVGLKHRASRNACYGRQAADHSADAERLGDCCGPEALRLHQLRYGLVSVIAFSISYMSSIGHESLAGPRV